MNLMRTWPLYDNIVKACFLSKFFGRARLLPSPIALVLEYQPEQRQEWKCEVNNGSARPLASQATVPQAR